MIKLDEKEQEKYRIRPARKWLMYLARSLALPFIDIFLRIFNRTQIIGRENIPDGGGVIFACNHISGVDTLLLPSAAINRFSSIPFMAPGKEELFKIPIVGRVISLWGSFPVKRRSRDLDSMKRIAFYAGHYRIMLFPEGTRSKTGELLKGRSGAGWIIHSARPKVIPVLVINTDFYFWPGRKKPWFRVPYKIVFGKPVRLDHLLDKENSKQNSQEIIDTVMDEIGRMRKAYSAAYIEPPKLTGSVYDRINDGEKISDADL